MSDAYQLRLVDLRVFVEAAGTLNYTRVAEAFSYTEPGVHSRIKAVENALGARLFARQGRGLVLTAAGRELLEPARAVLQQGDQLEAVSQKLQRDAHQTVIVAAGPIPGAYILPRMFAEFLDINSDVNLQLHVIPGPQDLLDRMQSGLIDVGVRAFPDDRLPIPAHAARRMEITPWIALPIVVVSSSEHHAAMMARLAAEHEIRLLVKSSSIIADKVAKDWMAAGTRATFVRLETMEAVKQSCLAGLGAALLPLPTIEMELRMGLLRVIPSPADALGSRFSIFVGRPVSPAARRLLDFLESRDNGPETARLPAEIAGGNGQNMTGASSRTQRGRAHTAEPKVVSRT